MKRILIVDDAIETRRQMQAALRGAYPDLAATAVPSAEEALLEATSLAFDVLVTELRLPGMNGIDLIRKMRVRQPAIHVIVLTGLPPTDRLVQRCVEAAPDASLQKPFAPADLLQVLEALLGLPRPADAPRQAAPISVLAAEIDDLLPGERVSTPAAAPQPETQPECMSDLLRRLRCSWNAQAVLLLDERGHALEQAGDLPSLSADWAVIPPLLTSLSAAAKVSHLLGQPAARVVQAFRGTEMDLVVAPVGQFCLLAALEPGRSEKCLAPVLEEINQACAAMAGVLEALGLRLMGALEVGAPEQIHAQGQQTAPQQPALAAAASDPPAHDPALETLEQLFASQPAADLRDADRFWQSASEQSSVVELPGVLSFDQAQKLGLLAWDKA